MFHQLLDAASTSTIYCAAIASNSAYNNTSSVYAKIFAGPSAICFKDGTSQLLPLLVNSLVVAATS